MPSPSCRSRCCWTSGPGSWWRRRWAPRPSWCSRSCGCAAPSEIERKRPDDQEGIDAGVGIVDACAREVREPDAEPRGVAELPRHVELEDEVEGAAQLLAVAPRIG